MANAVDALNDLPSVQRKEATSEAAKTVGTIGLLRGQLSAWQDDSTSKAAATEDAIGRLTEEAARSKNERDKSPAHLAKAEDAVNAPILRKSRACHQNPYPQNR